MNAGDPVVVERQHTISLCFGQPQRGQFPDLLGMLRGDVVRLRAVDVDVKQLPAVLIEMAFIDHRAVLGRHLPAVVP